MAICNPLGSTYNMDDVKLIEHCAIRMQLGTGWWGEAQLAALAPAACSD